MSIYLGEDGQFQIKRRGIQALTTTIEPADVTVEKRRFSADFPASALITGDQIEIATQDRSNLELVAGHDHPDIYVYCHVDDTGGIRLYDNFEAAVNGGLERALQLVTPSHSQPVFIRNRDEVFNCTAQIRQYELTTERETVDLTVLGNDFRDNYANGLISGQGQLSCFWEYRYNRDCEEDLYGTELPHYYAQLVLRLKQGSSFDGRFFIYKGNATQPSVWYEATCIVTNVSFAFAPGTPITTDVQFVTTGPIVLHTGTPPGFLLQEDRDLILQENDSGISLEDPD